jgi:hypothetical protein
LASLPVVALLAACSPAPFDRADSGGDRPAPEGTGAPTVSPTPVGSLTGEYRVAGIDGEALDLPFALTLSIDDRSIVNEGVCGGDAWDYRLEGTDLTLTRTRSPDPACLATVRVDPVVFRLPAAIDAATRAERTPSNGIELSGGGHSVTLYSQ